jgi:hypothetical protein
MINPTTEVLSPTDMAQIRLAAQGMISGKLREWPLLDRALKKCEINLHGSATRSEIIPICQDLLTKLESENG